MEKKKIIILHDKTPEIKDRNSNDAIQELSSVSLAISRLGYRTIKIEMSVNVTSLVSQIIKINPYIVFNLAKNSHNPYGHIQILLSMLENNGIRVTGAANQNAFFSCNNMCYLKKILNLSHVNTPKWQTLKKIQEQGICLEFPFILKKNYTCNNTGIRANIVCKSEAQFYDIFRKLDPALYSKLFIESYIKGQEFNVCLLGSDGGSEIFADYKLLSDRYCKKDNICIYNILPFNAYIVNNDSIHSKQQTSDDIDFNLLHEINKIVLTCWNNFLFNGYAILHFIIDNEQKPWIVGITINPSLSRDSFFVKSALKTGYTYEGLIIKIIDESVLYKNVYCS